MGRRGKELEKLRQIVLRLANNEKLDPRHRDHALTGEWEETRDCHIEPDWILIYTPTDTHLRLEKTGTHSDLFCNGSASDKTIATRHAN